MIPKEEYLERIGKVQQEMKERNLDLLVTYSSECESANSRYLADFWPFFDFDGVAIPVEGEAVLLTGGPESLDFAQRFSQIEDIRVHPMFVETSAPEWVPKVSEIDFSVLIAELFKDRKISRIGLAGSNIFPHPIFENLREGVGGAEIVPADEVLLKVRSIKSENEIQILQEAYRITEEAMKAALDYAEEGRMEWEIEAKARSVMYSLGAEGTSYPIWVCSGPNTKLSLCRSTERKIGSNELVQLSLGAKYKGYCGNMCRPFAIGSPPDNIKKLMAVGLEAEQKAIESIGPGVKAADVYRIFKEILDKYGYGEFALYGPAHGTGMQECEGPWLDDKTGITIQPNMVFNVDIWLSDGEAGLRYEDGIVVTETGVKELTTYKREIIAK
jgi:Xaa-Pro aminopeptidase